MEGYGAAVQAIFGVIGTLLENNQRAKAERLLRLAQEKFEDIPLPTLEEIEAQQLGPSAMEGLRTDPALAEAQRGALGSLDDIISGGGLAQVDSATLNRLASQVARRNRSAQAGIGAEMAARGMQGSGVDIGARLAAAQAAQERNSQASQDIAAQALMRRFNAISQKGEMAGRMRGQEFDEGKALADARDTINRLNAASRERAQYYNAGLPQQRFQNAMSKQGAVANPMNALAGFHQQSGQQTGQMFAGLGAAASRLSEGWGKKDEDSEDEWWRSRGGSTYKLGSDEDDK